MIVIIDGQPKRMIQQDEVFSWINEKWQPEISTSWDDSLTVKTEQRSSQIEVNETTLSALGVPRKITEAIAKNQISGPGRPKDIHAPVPIRFEISVKYENKIHRITGTFSYSVNEDYKAEGDQSSCYTQKHCARYTESKFSCETKDEGSTKSLQRFSVSEFAILDKRVN